MNDKDLQRLKNCIATLALAKNLCEYGLTTESAGMFIQVKQRIVLCLGELSKLVEIIEGSSFGTSGGA
jgi:hypothetical protein